MNSIRHTRNARILVVPLLISLCGSNSYALWNDQNTPGQNFVTGVCAVGAAVLGVVGAVALADWCFSETDDQLIARFDRECCNFDSQYNSMMNFVEALRQPIFPLHNVGHMMDYYGALESLEKGVYEAATRIKNSGVSQYTYRNNAITAKNQLQSSMSKLYKHIHALERIHCNYDEQRRLRAMRTLSHRAEQLIKRATFFVDYLEHHKSYFNLYEIVNELRSSYDQALAIAECAGMYAENNLKNGIITSYSERYPFREFVHTVESDIARLRSGINSLAHNYETGKQYVNNMLGQLVWMKNVVVADYRYSQECCQWEQERLHQLQIEAMKAQERAMREQNRILEHNNWLRQQELWRRDHCPDVKVVVTL